VEDYAAVEWTKLKDSEKVKYRGAKAEACRVRMENLCLAQSCVWAEYRVTAQEIAISSIDDMIRKKSVSKMRHDSSQSLCMLVMLASRTQKYVHLLRTFNEDTLKAEADIWCNKNSDSYKAIAPLILDLIAKAEYRFETWSLFSDGKNWDVV
jgi:hypothetical protein